MNRILVTGAGGFIGTWMCDELAQRHTVVAVDDLSGCTDERIKAVERKHALDSEGRDSACRFHFGSCMNRTWMRDLFRHYRIDTLVHLAANARENMSQFQPGTVTDRNLGAYSHTLSAAIETGVKNVVCFSSLAVYGEGTKKPPFSEDQLPQPEDVYGVNKYAMEMMTRILCPLHNVNHAIIRPHNVFGEGQELRDPCRNVVGIFLNKIMRDEPLVLFNRGNNVRAFSYIGDALPAFCNVIENVNKFDGLVVNIGGEEHVTVRELAAEVLRAYYHDDGALAKAYPLRLEAGRPCEVEVAYTDNTIQREKVGYVENIGWRKGVQRMADWARTRGPQAWQAFDQIEIDSPLIPNAVREMFPGLADSSTRK